MAGTPTKRDDLIRTALDLFSREGFHATGIDRILSEAGVAKMTLYKHFKSKDELIVQVLRHEDQRRRAHWSHTLASRAVEPAAQLMMLFEVMGEWIREPGFTGCVFVHAAGEFAQQSHAVHQAAAAHKQALLDDFEQLAAAAGAPHPQRLARQLLLLIDGAVALAHTAGDRAVIDDATHAARILLHEAGITLPNHHDAA